MNGRYPSVQKLKINWDHVFDATPLPRVTERTPQEEIEYLHAKIADEQETIRAFGSSRVALDARGRLAHYELEIQKWEAVINAENKQAADRVRRAEVVYGYPPELYRARRATFIADVEARNGVTK